MQPFPRLGRRRALAALFAHVPAVLSVEPPAYPKAAKGDVVDSYHGVKVADPYRWLENADDPETVRLGGRAERAHALVARPAPSATAITDAPDASCSTTRALSVPERQGTRYFYSRNTGLQNQSVLYVREGRRAPSACCSTPTP